MVRTVIAFRHECGKMAAFAAQKKIRLEIRGEPGNWELLYGARRYDGDDLPHITHCPYCGANLDDEEVSYLPG